jgi:hypothetical protein
MFPLVEFAIVITGEEPSLIPYPADSKGVASK